MKLAVVAGLAVTLVAAASASGKGADVTAKVCGRSRCVVLPFRLTNQLATRDDSFSDVPQPKPAPYFRVVTKSTDDGFITRTILWVPSAHDAWFMKEYVSPPIPGYWRTPNSLVYPDLRQFAKKLQPFPRPSNWRKVEPR